MTRTPIMRARHLHSTHKLYALKSQWFDPSAPNHQNVWVPCLLEAAPLARRVIRCREGVAELLRDRVVNGLDSSDGESFDSGACERCPLADVMQLPPALHALSSPRMTCSMALMRSRCSSSRVSWRSDGTDELASLRSDDGGADGVRCTSRRCLVRCVSPSGSWVREKENTRKSPY